VSTKEDQDLIAKGLMAYKQAHFFNEIEIQEMDDLAERLGLPEKYYQKERVD
jgi:hypothetical protein